MPSPERTPGGLLAQIDSPADLKRLGVKDLQALSDELREFILRSVAAHPGHLGANLGVVELTVALLYTYSLPEDKIVWDVGHQAYAYKILTGRREAFSTNRQWGGIAGFPARVESPYDAFGTGHSSTSISAALGMATAFELQGKSNRTVAVIGDGALTGGLAFEALNNGGASGAGLLVVLNDNRMSIDPNVGALSEYLLDISTSPHYNRMKDRIWHLLSRSRGERKPVRRKVQTVNRAIKGALLKNSNLFEAFGFRYFGPIDGHDVEHLVEVLKDLRNLPGPKLLHCITKKGKGYEPAEREQTVWHAPGRFDYDTGKRIKEEATGRVLPKFQDVFGDTLLEIAREDSRVVGITPAMPTGSSLITVMRELPERTYDVGIAEQHAVTFAAGLAAEGQIPYCVIYSSFMQRAYDQVVHDVALQNLHVVFCLDRAGLVGEDGATHHGAFDLAYLRPIPNLTICAPMDSGELRSMMRLARQGCGPWVIRYPRGAAPDHVEAVAGEELMVGRGRQLREGDYAAILSLGVLAPNALEAAELLAREGKEVAVYDFRFLKPLDVELLHEVATRYEHLYTLEDGVLAGGFGSAVVEELCAMGYAGHCERFGIGDAFVPHGSVARQQASCGLRPEQIAERLRQRG